MPFVEGFVEADGFRIRYKQAGSGPAVVHVHGAGGLRLTPAHDILSQRYQVIAFEVPGFGESAVNERSKSIADVGHTMNLAVGALGIDRFSLWGTSFGGRVALAMAFGREQALDALVLESPAAIRPEGHVRERGTPEQNAQMLYAHPERQPPPAHIEPAILQKQEALLARLRTPNRDPELEAKLAELELRTLVLFGTEDKMIPSEMGSIYKEKMKSCYFVLVYDAGHAIASDRPEAFAGIVDDFLQRQERFIVSATPSVIQV